MPKSTSQSQSNPSPSNKKKEPEYGDKGHRTSSVYRFCLPTSKGKQASFSLAHILSRYETAENNSKEVCTTSEQTKGAKQAKQASNVLRPGMTSPPSIHPSIGDREVGKGECHAVLGDVCIIH
jgi:hypothetical protein